MVNKYTNLFCFFKFHRQQVEMKLHQSGENSKPETPTTQNASSGRNSERSTPGLNQNNPDEDDKEVMSSPALSDYLEKRSLPEPSQLNQALDIAATLDPQAREKLDAELAKCQQFIAESDGMSSSESGKVKGQHLNNSISGNS